MQAPDSPALGVSAGGSPLEADFLRPMPLRYRLGEWTLGSWQPRLRVMVPRDFGASAWPPAAAALSQSLSPEADGILCRKVDAARFEPGLARYGAWLSYVQYRDVVHCVALQGSFADYLKSFSPKARQNLQRSVRRFGERQQGQPAWQLYTLPEEMASFHAEALAISRQTYQTRLLGAGLPEDAGFVQQMQALAARGEARGYLLRDAGQAIAFAWCRGQGRRLVYDIIGYLPEQAAHSPGTVLLYHVLEDAFAQQDRYELVDFGPGEAQYKAMFANLRHEFVDLYLLRPSLKHRLCLRAHWLLLNGVDRLGRWLEQRGWKRRVRQLMRRLRGGA